MLWLAGRQSMTSDTPKYRPLERFWPYADLPEQPTDQELAALDPDLQEALFGASPRPFSITIVFPALDVPDFARALDIARASAEYRETGAGATLRHRARFWSTDALHLRELFEIVGGSDSTDVLLDDRPVRYPRACGCRSVWFLIPAVASVAESSPVGQDLLRLEAETKRLEAEYNMFFSGRLPKPPWETRSRVEALVKRYDRAHIQNFGDRFRFTTLQTRFATLVDRVGPRASRPRRGTAWPVHRQAPGQARRARTAEGSHPARHDLPGSRARDGSAREPV